MSRPRDVEQREWLRSDESSEAGIWLRLEAYTNKDDALTSYTGSLTLRDCTRSVTIDLDGCHDDDEEALRLLRDYADKALRWIERCRKQIRVEVDNS